MRFSQNIAPKLAFFPKGGIPWRIDWIGDVAFPDRYSSYRQPAICLAISRTTQANPGRCCHDDTLRSQRQIWAPVGLLPNFRIGDIWQDGFLLQREAAPTEVFEEVKVNSTSNRLAKAGVAVDGRGFLLPFKEHPWHINHTHSYCLVARLAGNRQLVIPCAELIRFYFGSSSSLLSVLFRPPLNKKRLFTSANFHPQSGRLHLKLEAGISGYSASDIGRLHLDPNAWKAALEIGLSLIQASTRRSKAYPYMHFPFTGQTTLAVIGEWLPFGKRPAQSFLVHSIQSCSHPFPFRTLAYEMQQRPNSFASKPQLWRDQVSAPASQFARIANPSSLLYKDSSSRFSPSVWHEWHGVKFPDLEGKDVFRQVLLKDRKAEQQFNHPRKTSVSDFAVGESTGTHQSVRPLELSVTQQVDAFASAPKFLREYLSELTSIPSLTIRLMTESRDDGWSVAVNAMQNDIEEIDKRLYHSGEKGYQIRRACVLYVEVSTESFGLLTLLEATPTQVHFSSGVPDTELGVAQVLETTALKFLKSEVIDAYEFIRVLATDRDLEKCLKSFHTNIVLKSKVKRVRKVQLD